MLELRQCHLQNNKQEYSVKRLNKANSSLFKAIFCYFNHCFACIIHASMNSSTPVRWHSVMSYVAIYGSHFYVNLSAKFFCFSRHIYGPFAYYQRYWLLSTGFIEFLLFYVLLLIRFLAIQYQFVCTILVPKRVVPRKSRYWNLWPSGFENTEPNF